jgi:hypothetical protein
VIQGAMRVHEAWDRQRCRLEQIIAGTALACLDPASLRYLTVRVYAETHEYESVRLFDWEETWFSRDLPPAPARILVGAAGTGREAAYLDSKGYVTVAFDPVPSVVRYARQRQDLPRCVAFLEGSFEDLAAPGCDASRSFQAEILRHAPYDAVLLGWTSINHLPRHKARRDLLVALRRLCPCGPLLFSHWQDEDPVDRGQTRSWRLGWKLGTWLAGDNAVDPAEVLGDTLTTHAGYAHRFTEAEIRDLATTAGYDIATVTLSPPDNEHPHATVIPRREG